MRTIIKHEKTEMLPKSRHPVKSKPHGVFRGGTNVWFNVYQCPACQAFRAVLSNPDRDAEGRRKMHHCTGVERSNYWKELAQRDVPATRRAGTTSVCEAARRD